MCLDGHVCAYVCLSGLVCVCEIDRERERETTDVFVNVSDSVCMFVNIHSCRCPQNMHNAHIKSRVIKCGQSKLQTISEVLFISQQSAYYTPVQIKYYIQGESGVVLASQYQ